MEKRFVLFVVLAMAILYGQMALMRWMQGPPPPPAAQAPEGNPAAIAPANPPANTPEDVTGAVAGAPQPVGDQPAPPPAEKPLAAPVAPAAPVEGKRLTLGSADPKSPFRMLVTLTTAGAAVERIELNSPRYRDVENESGYLGHLAAVDAATGPGATVRNVDPGSPAQRAGLQVGDTIRATKIGKRPKLPVASVKSLELLLESSRPRERVTLEVERDGRTIELSTELSRKPLEILRPEHDDPLSFLLTLESLDGAALTPEAQELTGLAMRTGNWQVVSPDPQGDANSVAFSYRLPDHGLEVIKRYRLRPLDAAAAAPAPVAGDVPSPEPVTGYHLMLELEFRNTGQAPRTLSYRLDGPTGLPTEGEWYASKVSRTWGASGLRDAAAGFLNNGRLQPVMANLADVVGQETSSDWEWDKPVVQPLAYLGVDAQYFAAMLLPLGGADKAVLFPQARPLVVGRVPEDTSRTKLVNLSCRLVSATISLEAGATHAQAFRVFVGPKQPDLLEQYGLGELIYYGWFGAVSRLLAPVLHFFNGVTGNYGIAIVLLTVLVRSLMFPISRQQAVNAQKMQELQPEMKRIAEKYKNNVEGRTKAQQELFRKMGYNPFAGCLPAFLQIPIFLGLYRTLSVDIELRQAPLISEAVRWCSNLAAPDMLFRWDSWLPNFFQGWLGPYFNLLPLFTVALFLVQQKLFMPPPADEQARVQQNTMQIMMVFMGVMFFKVPSGLCIYFIASSLWGLGERMLLPKSKPALVTSAA